jgi:hypothetical protein
LRQDADTSNWSPSYGQRAAQHDTIEYFRVLAEKNGVPYQNLINLYLRDCAQSGRKLSMKWE